MEDTITMTDILSRILRSWKKLLAAAVIVAILLGGFQSYRMLSLAGSPDNTPEAIESRYQTAMETYDTQKDSLTKSLENNQKLLDTKQDYEENSLLMGIDPYDAYVSSIVIGFTGINGQGAVQGSSQYQQTSAEYLVQMIRGQYIALWKNMDVATALDLPAYAQTKSKYLAEVISVEEMDGGLCAIKAVGSSADKVEELTSAVYQYFLDHQASIAASSYDHNISVISRSTTNQVDQTLIDKHNTLNAEIQAYADTVKNLQSQLDALTQPVKEAGYSAGTIAKSAITYAVLGFFLGLILGCFWICCLCIFGSRMSSSHQAEQLCGISFLGSLKIPRNIMDRFSASMSSERVWKDPDEASSYLFQQVKAHHPQGEEILVLSTLSSKQATGVETLRSALTSGGYTVSAVLDATHNPEAVEALSKSRSVILAEAVDATRLWEMKDLVSQVNHAGKQILGFVML